MPYANGGYFDRDAQRWVYPGGLTSPGPVPNLGPATSGSVPTATGGSTGTAGVGVNTPGFAEALNLINSMNITAQQKANEARIPNALALETQSSENIGSALRGELPDDVLRLLGQQGAERGIMTGTAGSPNDTAAYMRALGLTSLNLQNQGQDWLTGAYGRNPGAPLYDPTKLMITPAQQAELDLQMKQLALQERLGLARLQADMLSRRPYGNAGYNGGFMQPTTPSPVDVSPYVDTTPAPSTTPGTWSASSRLEMPWDTATVGYDLPEWMKTAVNPIWNGNFADATVSYDLPAALPDYTQPFGDWLSGIGLSYGP